MAPFQHSRRLALSVAVASAMVTCACADVDAASQRATIRVFKSLGSVQCSGGGKDIALMSRELSNAGLEVISSTCGTDGHMHPMLCGANDGRIGIFEIGSKDMAAASRLGFAPLSRLPEAQVLPCQSPSKPLSPT